MKSEPIQFQTFLEQEINRVKGVYYPVRAGFLRRALIRHAQTISLHPNPDDEFCSPEIGPNYGIIAKYEQQYKKNVFFKSGTGTESSETYDPLMVQRARPDGYLILNGHHRWAAAFRSGMTSVSVKIVNLTQEKDIRKMIQDSKTDKRVSLDLDEVVFGAPGDAHLEKPMPFPLNHVFRERLRQGVPALFRYLTDHGYDIWVYTAKYCSVEHIRWYFKYCSVRLAGIITGTGRKDARGIDPSGDLKKLMENQYRSTVHIDNNLIVRTLTGSREAEEVSLSGNPGTWAREVMEALDKMT